LRRRFGAVALVGAFLSETGSGSRLAAYETAPSATLAPSRRAIATLRAKAKSVDLSFCTCWRAAQVDTFDPSRG